MSLNWNIEDIENNREVCWVTREPMPSEGWSESDLNEDGTVTVQNPVTKTLIFSCMFVGHRGITEENVGSFCARLSLYQDVHGALMQGKDEETGEFGPVRVTDEDVIAHIGLSTNTPTETDAQFVKRNITEDLKRNSARRQREITEARTAVAA